jgi:hypothetical protein
MKKANTKARGCETRKSHRFKKELFLCPSLLDEKSHSYLNATFGNGKGRDGNTLTLTTAG